jgi:hypothetical protein
VSFVGRALSLTFVKGPDAQGNPQTFANGSNTITIPEGNMASVRVLNAGTPGMAHADITVWGLTADIMNQISTLGIIVSLQPGNLVAVYASDAGGANKSEVFKGCIWQAMPQFNRQPETPLWIDAYSGLEVATNATAATSFTGDSDLITILQQLCKTAGYKFENNGVSGVSLSRSYLWGSPRDQIISVLQSVRTRGVTGAFVENQTLAIWPTTKARGGNVPIVRAGTATTPGTLIGYPTYTVGGVDFRCIYNPNLRFGGQVQLETSLPQASGLWNITAGLSAHLDAQIPGGKWENIVEAIRTGYPTPVVSTQG